jgi:gas vesicle protein
MLKYIITSLLLLSCSALISCGFGDLTLTAQFNEVDTLATGGRILYRNTCIGDVGKIVRTDVDHYLVELDIDSEYKKLLSVFSIFYIDDDPDQPTQKALFTEQSQPGGILLTDNSVVIGQDDPPYLQHMKGNFKRKTEELANELAEKITWSRESYEKQSTELTRQLEETLSEIDWKLRELEKTVQTTPESNEVKELKWNLDLLVNDLETTLEVVATTISQDLYDRLQKSLDSLKHRLDELNRKNQPSFPQEGQAKV